MTTQHGEPILTFGETLQLLALGVLPGLLLALGVVAWAQRRAARRASAAFLVIGFVSWLVLSLALTLMFWWQLPHTNPFLHVSPALDMVGSVVIPGLAAQAVVLPALYAVLRRHLADRGDEAAGAA